MPIVSIVLPVYNGEKYVLRAIDSIRKQTFSNWELIILDDGSRDRSILICQECAEQDSRIKVYRNSQNLGLSKTMNRLVYLAQGKYLAIQEQDDISVPDRCEKEVNFLEVHPEVGLVSGIAAGLNDDQEIYRYFGDGLLRGDLLPNNLNDMVTYLYVHGRSEIRHAACMFRKSILVDLPIPFDEDAKIPDPKFLLDIAHRYKIAGIPEILILFQRGQTHKSFSSNSILSFNENIKGIKKVYKEYRFNRSSPITYILYRNAMSNQILHYSLSLEGIDKLLKINSAIFYYPLNYRAWKYFLYFILGKIKFWLFLIFI